jgi:F0F1-type ATP synthase epsilon subunit
LHFEVAVAAFPCSIVTPSESVLSVDATYVSFPAWDGQKGVMAGASPFLVKLGVGPLRIDLASGGTEMFLLDGGFAQLQNGKLTLITDQAVTRSSIERAAADRELAEANAKVLEPGRIDLAERAKLEHAQHVAAAKVALSRN